MEPNPYEAPRFDCRVEQAVHEPERTVRRWVPLAIAVVWNLPLLVILALTGAEVFDAETMFRMLAAWSLVIPVVSVALIFVKPFQRLVFEPRVDIAKMRPRLWGLAILWLAIFGVWLLAMFVWGLDRYEQQIANATTCT
jgi:hypothetical protein